MAKNELEGGKQEMARIERRKKWAITKRSTLIASIRAVHACALRVADETHIIPEFLVKVNTLDALWSQFEEEDNTVLDCLISLDSVDEYSIDLIPEVRALVDRSKAVAGSCNGTIASGSGTNPVNENLVNQDINKSFCRLPEIPLPQFSGDFHEWATFRDRFIALVDARPGLSKTDKIYYLIGCVQGVAADSIRGIPASAENYELMWTTLSNRFNRPRLLATSLIDKLLNVPAFTQESLQELDAFVKTFEESIALLKSLEIEDFGSFLLFSVAFRCLPLMTRKLFESSTSVVYPSVSELLKFVHTRISILENVGDPRKSTNPVRTIKSYNQQSQPSKLPQKKSSHVALVVSKSNNGGNNTCVCCKGAHNLISCPQFRDSFSVDERCRFTRENRLCFNCLSARHWSNKCPSKTRCSTCSQRHHSLLHLSDTKNPVSPVIPPTDAALCASASLSRPSSSAGVLLGTALIHVRDRSGTWQVVRALIDSASQISAITSSCSDQLGLHRIPWTNPISGLSATPVSGVSGIATCVIQPRFATEPTFTVKAWVLPVITGNMPRQQLPAIIKDRYSDLALADPTFHLSSPVDMLLGADLFAEIMDGHKVSVHDSLPTAFSSIFGWILIGSVSQSAREQPYSLPLSLTVSIEDLMDRFWRVEEPTVAPLSFSEEGKCNEIFETEHYRLPSGRFVVPLPSRMHVSKMNFPGSREMAIQRFYGLERKLSTNPKLRSQYCAFMSEYLSLGHMSVAVSPGQYFIPHHAVFRPDDHDKIRVVFDASARSPRSPSLNQCLIQGPKLQQDIVDILTRFRVHKFAFTADICKMYRQILVLPEYRRLQHILWRSTPTDDLLEYELNTVTYGLNCAPFLALRVLQSVANTDCNDYPDVRDALLRQTYVDDICVGADSVAELRSLQNNLISVLKGAGLELKKWLSNSVDVINAVPIADCLETPIPFDSVEGGNTKVLGLLWNPNGDYFGCALRLDTPPIYTKRGVLSLISRIFDPLGLFAPTVFLAKHIMQRTWQSKLPWDAPLPSDVQIEWRNFVSELPTLSTSRIPRHLATVNGSPCALFGFCDASTRGYAAVVYIRVMGAPRDSCVFLVGTKTKLAPLKPMTVPRLELNAAVLLARWMSRIKSILESQLTIVDMCAWTDSSTVLSWLTVSHATFKVYVSNRVHQILSLLPECCWYYVKSGMNPADCASRGVFPSELSDLSLYWQGPDFMRDDKTSWDGGKPLIPAEELPEIRPLSLLSQVNEPAREWFEIFSSYDHMIRVVAQMFRFINRCRKRIVNYHPSLTRSELDAAERCVVTESQRCFFSALRRELSSKSAVSVKSLARLRPFIDDEQVIRVGGRLRNSTLAYETKHPILISKGAHLAVLLVRRWHKITCHSGPRLLTMLISRRFWIVSIRSVIHGVITKCLVCVKLDTRAVQPLMADLPAARVQECRPFSRVGVDYAGPLQMRETRLRKARTYKVYIAVFVCFSVKATHLELVSELSTAAFLAAFDRFVARRGLPSEIFSDCGTNFIGADKQLQLLINSPVGRAALLDARPCCKWNFNPPAAPHFGGLWEAAVRSAKRLLVRVMGTHILSYEELTTVITRIEAVLNSRPITPLSNDPHDLEALTPGHFLIGQPLLAVPSSLPLDTNVNIRNRWKLLDQCHQAFWRRWAAEYLTTLQARPKWTKDGHKVKVNDMVIVIDNLAPPLKWRLGRVIAIFPGTDGVVRVARVLTQQGELTRPVVKLIPLPTQ